MSREVDLGQIVPKIQVGTTTTGSPSSQASVINVGTDLNPIFNFTIPKGNTGATPNIQIGTVQTGDSSEVTRTGTNENPILNFTLEKGDTGNGIASITKTSTSGLVDTYTITFTNGQTTTYEITNGANGSVVDVQVDGTSVVDNGIANIIGLTEMKQELEDMYNLLPKVQGTGETITLDGTVVGKMLIDLKGNTSQEGTPTPETPQNIHVVSGDNEVIINSKNLLKPYQLSGSHTTNGLTATMQSNGTILVNGTATGNTWIEFVKTFGNTSETTKILYPLDTTKTYIQSSTVISGTISGTANFSIQVNTNVNSSTSVGATRQITGANGVYRAWLYVRKDAVLTNAVIGFQLEKGSTATTYEPYQSQSYPINLGDIELCKIGDYQDSIVKDNGKWFLHKEIGKVAFSDLVFTEIGGNFSQFSTNGNIAMVYLQNDLKVTGNRDDVFCNLLKPYSSSLFGGLQTGINQYYNATKLLLSVPLANVEEFAGETLTVNNYLSYTQNYINGLEGYIYYILATPTTTEITDSTLLSQLEALNGAKSYNSQTNINQENNDLPFILDATALKQLTQ